MSIQNSLSPVVRPHRLLRTVLVGVSLGEESDRVIRTGLAVTRAAGARIYLVHAAQPEPLPLAVSAAAEPVLQREEIARRSEELRGQIERLGITPGELAGFEARVGAPHHVLLETAERIAADLIVVGAVEPKLSGELLGSTTDRLLRKAHAPVLVVRNELRMPLGHVLVPVDLSTLSGDAFHCGLHLLDQIAGRGEMRVKAILALGFTASPGPEAPGRPSEQAERSAIRQLQLFVRENRPQAFPIETAVLAGEARQEILRELEEHPVDLLVLGTHGHSGLDELVLGSVASTIARNAPCSMLVISPEAALSDEIARPAPLAAA